MVEVSARAACARVEEWACASTEEVSAKVAFATESRRECSMVWALACARELPQACSMVWVLVCATELLWANSKAWQLANPMESDLVSPKELDLVCPRVWPSAIPTAEAEAARQAEEAAAHLAALPAEEWVAHLEELPGVVHPAADLEARPAHPEAESAADQAAQGAVVRAAPEEASLRAVPESQMPSPRSVERKRSASWRHAKNLKSSAQC
jgi:hypothetical protein